MKPFACPFCDYTHQNPSILVHHINSYHVRSPEENEGGHTVVGAVPTSAAATAAGASTSGVPPTAPTTTTTTAAAAAPTPTATNPVAGHNTLHSNRNPSTTAIARRNSGPEPNNSSNSSVFSRSAKLSRRYTAQSDRDHHYQHNHHRRRGYKGSTVDISVQPPNHHNSNNINYNNNHNNTHHANGSHVIDPSIPPTADEESHLDLVHDYDHGHDDRDAPSRHSSRRQSRRPSTDVATPGLIFKGFFNACRNSIGHSNKDLPRHREKHERGGRQSPPKHNEQSVDEPPRSTDLGPYANEKRMPKSLYRQLKAGPRIIYVTRTRADGRLERVQVIENETANIIPLLQRFSTLDTMVAQAVYCAPHVRHVFKLEDEGGFCGYRNIQMLISYIQECGGGVKGSSQFSKKELPSILELQDMIEEAWDKGFNTIGRIDTGGIRGTRKYIGTSEAQALFQSKGISCQPEVFFSNKDRSAHEALVSRVWEYFLSSDAEVTESKVITTKMPPMYLQHHGHSMTIVGAEKHLDGSDHLIVLDPGMKTISEVRTLVDRNIVQCGKVGYYMSLYRRDSEYLSMYNAFELLRLDV